MCGADHRSVVVCLLETYSSGSGLYNEESAACERCRAGFWPAPYFSAACLVCPTFGGAAAARLRQPCFTAPIIAEAARIGAVKQTRQSVLSGWLGWLGGHELAILILLFAIAAGVWAFAKLASEVEEGETSGFDRRILLGVRPRN